MIYRYQPPEINETEANTMRMIDAIKKAGKQCVNVKSVSTGIYRGEEYETTVRFSWDGRFPHHLLEEVEEFAAKLRGEMNERRLKT